MLKYVLAATALRAFSFSPWTKRLYRLLGNTLGAENRARGTMPLYYFECINRTLRFNRCYGVPKDGDSFLELGTGWLHWEAITSKLFFNVEGILFDVWDNRQMKGLLNYITQLDYMIDDLDAEDTQKSNAHRLISEIKDIKRFNDLYKLIEFHYIIDASGKLDKLESASFNFVVSAGVLEHIHKDIVSEFVQSIAAVLKPGGYTFHAINLRDHLIAYDKSVSAKQYLRYQDHTWKRWFENDVQYINRIQCSEWLELFRKAGLVLIEEEIGCINLSGMKVAKTYQQFDTADLSCVDLHILYRKPE